MAKVNGAQRESGGVVVAKAKRPDFGQAGNGGTREGMVGTAQPKTLNQLPLVGKVQQLQTQALRGGQAVAGAALPGSVRPDLQE